MVTRRRHQALAALLVVGCARTNTSSDPPDAQGQHDAQRTVETRAEDETPARRTLPNPRGFRPTRGFKAIDAEIVWTCEGVLAPLHGALVHGEEELRTALAATGSDFVQLCAGEPPTIDFERHALAAVAVEFSASLQYAATRGQELELGILHNTYCGGPAPPGPTLTFVAVPAAMTTLAVVVRNVGTCEGPPKP